ncbi:hypothetical protein F5Y06DRAFT_276310 [Hypoxylon sp. FL0890]|nr:hypothetical protein F5Y06DRAFT_276310 [Hypoxylon sp. FL0890]
MPPKKNNNSASGEDATVILTAADVKLIDAVLKSCLPSSKPVPTDWEAIAKQTNLKDGKSVRERFRQVCKKHKWFEATVDDPNSPSPSPKKRAVSQMFPTPSPEEMVNPGSGEEGDVKGTPSKKRKTSPVKKRRPSNIKKAAKVKTELDGLEDNNVQDDEAEFAAMFGQDEA